MADKSLLLIVPLVLFALGLWAGQGLVRRGYGLAVLIVLALIVPVWAGLETMGRSLGGWHHMGASLAGVLYLLPPAAGLVLGALGGALAHALRRPPPEGKSGNEE